MPTTSERPAAASTGARSTTGAVRPPGLGRHVALFALLCGVAGYGLGGLAADASAGRDVRGAPVLATALAVVTVVAYGIEVRRQLRRADGRGGAA